MDNKLKFEDCIHISKKAIKELDFTTLGVFCWITAMLQDGHKVNTQMVKEHFNLSDSDFSAIKGTLLEKDYIEISNE